MQLLDPEMVFRTVDLLGVLVNALLGGAIARALKLDAIGFLVLAVLSGLGGGMIRDVLLQNGQPVALTDPAYLTTALIGTLIAFVLTFESRTANRVLIVADSLSLGCWAATGTSKALGAGLGWVPAIMLGLITAVGGGAVRDIAVGRIPAIFGGNTLYASGALVGSIEMVVLWELGRPNWGMAVAIVSAAALTVVARRQGWRLPGQGGWDVRQTGRQITRAARPRVHIHRGAAHLLRRRRAQRASQDAERTGGSRGEHGSHRSTASGDSGDSGDGPDRGDDRGPGSAVG